MKCFLKFQQYALVRNIPEKKKTFSEGTQPVQLELVNIYFQFACTYMENLTQSLSIDFSRFFS